MSIGDNTTEISSAASVSGQATNGPIRARAGATSILLNTTSAVAGAVTVTESDDGNTWTTAGTVALAGAVSGQLNAVALAKKFFRTSFNPTATGAGVLVQGLTG